MQSQGMRERLPWLVRAYLVAYAAGQILPTSIGGDAVRILETSRRHPARLGAISAIVLLERALGGAATVLLGAVGFLLAIGRYDVGAYLWLEGAFVFGTLLLAFLFFARTARPLLRWTRPLLAKLRLERPLRALYDGVHAFRDHGRLLGGVFALTVAVQAVRILAIWASARSVGHRPLAAALLRDGPALLPRPARAVHAERLRRARGVLRQLPRQRRRRAPTRPSRPASSSSSSRARWRCSAARSCSGRASAGGRARRMPDAGAVVVTYNALPWLEQCLESVRGVETIVVDNGSTDGTVELVRERFPDVQRGRAGEPRPRRRLERGHGGRSPGRYFLILNADAWLTAGLARAARRLRRRAPRGGGRRPAAAQPRRHAAALRARLPDALAARDRVPLPAQAGAAASQLLNAFYAGGFAHDEVREADFVMGACMLVRRAAVERGRPARRVVLPLQRGDRLVVPVRAGRLEDALLPRRGVRPRGRRLARRPAAPRERARPPPLPGQAPRRRLRRAGAPAAARGPRSCAASCSAASAAAMYRDVAGWLGSGRVPALLER